MGTGRSRLPKGIYNMDPAKADKLREKYIKAVHRKAEKTGFKLTSKADLYVDEWAGKYIEQYIKELTNYQKAMGLSKETIQDAGGPLDIRALTGALGNSTAQGVVTLNASYIDDPERLNTTLQHEATHNMVAYLITKEMGYPKGSLLHNSEWTDGTIEKSIQENALIDYKQFKAAELTRQINEFSNLRPGETRDRIISMLKNDLNNVESITVRQAARESGMRSYALKQYSWTTTGTYVEIPTVAAENFVKVNYNWDALKKEHPYSYFVLRELQRRLNN